jgi:ribonucleoside-diphosphate reductase alpha chain
MSIQIVKTNNPFKNEFSQEIWEQTYKSHEDATVHDTWARVAKNIASAEAEDKRDYYSNKFYHLLEDFKFVPAGRILSNAGAGWAGTTYINCFVKDRNKYDIDSLNGILSVLADQANTLKSEGGWGCNFSFIRPRGSFIHGIGVETPGAVKYAELFDKSSEIITSGSGRKSQHKKAKGKIRKGAMMFILHCSHPDIEEFITAKQTSGRLTKFNMSVAITDKFMDQLIEGKSDNWDLVFPDTTCPEYKSEWYGDIDDWQARGLPTIVHKTVSISSLWDLIMRSTYMRNDPGVFFIDRANKTHCWNYGPKRQAKILETNPCGEQCLPNAGTCNLGSLNLTQFVNDDLTDFDHEKVREAVSLAVRFLDNVNTQSSAPLAAYKDSMTEIRRIGLGVMGWGSALYLLKLRFGSEEAENLKLKLLHTITRSGISSSINLAIEKGAFIGCDPEKHADAEFFKQIGLEKEYIDSIRKYGIRNSALFSNQPTGNTGILANNVSGGIEPIFMPEYIRTSICPSCPEELLPLVPKYWEGDYSPNETFKLSKEGGDDILTANINGTLYKIDRNRGLTKETLCEDYAVRFNKEAGRWNPTDDYVVTAVTLSVEDHIRDMTSWAKHCDSAVSKTLNMPNDIDYEDFKKVYLDCYKTGYIKGFTTYRSGTMATVLKAKDETPRIELNTNSAPKRPKSLTADIYTVSAKNKKYIVVIGLLEDQPYEIFGGDANGFNFKSGTKGELVKVKRGHYSLNVSSVEIDDFNKHFTPEEQTLFRALSLMLRHGVPIQFVVEQMQKSVDDMFALPAVVARVLKKYIKDGQKVVGQVCPECGSANLVYQEGCLVCKDCGWSKCI